jgi:hypothetical protein
MKLVGSACAWLAALALAACSGEVQYVGEVHVTSPELIAIQPGVEVIADADEPVFYMNGYYWLYRDAGWLRSDSFKTGFVRIENDLVPDRLRDLREPESYAHYRRSQHTATFARSAPRPPQPARPPHANPMPDQQATPK